MNIYELEKLANEWREYYGDKNEFPPHIKTDDARREWLRDAGLANHYYTWHCRNNFMRALEALKEEHKVSVGYEGDMLNASAHCPKICDVCNLIKELEEV